MALSEEQDEHSNSKNEMAHIEVIEVEKKKDKDTDAIEEHQDEEKLGKTESIELVNNCADDTVEVEVAEANEENKANVEVQNNKPKSRTPKLDFFMRLFPSRKSRNENGKVEEKTESGFLLQEKEEEIQNELCNEVKPNEAGNGEEEKGSSNTTDVTIPVTNEDDNDQKRQTKMFTAQFNSTKWRWILASITFFLIILFIIVFLLAKLTFFPPDLLTINEDPLAFTECGEVWGTKTNDGLYVFQGIPYAVPPKGALRWKPPQPLSTIEDCWVGTYMATNQTPFCMQKSFYGRNPEEFDEDCLYLNVYTPSLDYSRPLPVVVYIHGNSLQELDANDLEWQPDASLAMERSAVIVTFNYRLNIFGFMMLDILEKAVRPNTSGNYGFQDQLAVLRWVQKNIHFFGGNPNKVTILAHGSGATSTLALLSSKYSKGLFRQVWMSGGSVLFSNKTTSYIESDNEDFLKNTNCHSVECLYGKSSSELYEALPERWTADKNMKFPDVSEKDSPTIAAVDVSVLFDTPMEIWKHKALLINDPEAMLDEMTQEEIQRLTNEPITVVIGSASQASAFYTNEKDDLDWMDYLKDLNRNDTDEIFQFYSNISSEAELQQQTLISDIRITCPLQEMATIISKATGDNAYFYIVDYKPSKPLNASYGGLSSPFTTPMSTHGLDILAILNKLDQYIYPLTNEDQDFQNNMQDMFFNFVHHGLLIGSQSQLRKASHTVNLIKDTVEFEKAPYKNCRFWDIDEVLKFGRRN